MVTRVTSNKKKPRLRPYTLSSYPLIPLCYHSFCMQQYFSQIIGHERQVGYLKTLLEKQSFSHAYVFSGMAGLQKREVAVEFLKAILGNDSALEAQAEAVVVDFELDKKTGELKRSVSVEQIRSMRERLQLSSFSDGFRVAFIPHADRMTTTAQNALLKTLEEPRKKTVIVLVVEDVNRLLPTILSRSVLVRFDRVSRAQTEAYLKKQGVSDVDARFFAVCAEGAPKLALQYAQNSSLRLELEDADRFFTQHSFAQVMQEVERVAKSVSRDEALRYLSLLRRAAHDLFLRSVGCGDLAAADSASTQRSPESYTQVLEAIEESFSHLQYNGSQSLALEHIAFASHSYEKTSSTSFT